MVQTSAMEYSGYEKFGIYWNRLPEYQTIVPSNWSNLFMHKNFDLESKKYNEETDTGNKNADLGSTLLNSENWKGFIPTDSNGKNWTEYVEYAIGGVTIEMWCEA